METVTELNNIDEEDEKPIIETEEFKEKHKGEDWKLIMMNIEINKLGKDGWEMVSNNGSDQIYFKRLDQT